VTSPRGSISRVSGVCNSKLSNFGGDQLPVSESTPGSDHVVRVVDNSATALVDYRNWLGGGEAATPEGGRSGILQGRGRRIGGAAGRGGRSTVTFLSPVRDGRPSAGASTGSLGPAAALDSRPYAATLKPDRCSSAVPVTVTASASLPRRRHEVWPAAAMASAGCPECSARTSRNNGPDCGRCRDRATPSYVTDGRLASSSEQWPTCRATPSEWPLNIGTRLQSSEDTPV